MLYLDTSCLVKLVVAEAESTVLRRWLRARAERRVTSDLSRVELERAVRASGATDAVVASAKSLFDGLALIPLGSQVIQSAASLSPASLRSLDAIHLASALLMGVGTTVCTYDERLAAAARHHRLDVASPA